MYIIIILLILNKYLLFQNFQKLVQEVKKNNKETMSEIKNLKRAVDHMKDRLEKSDKSDHMKGTESSKLLKKNTDDLKSYVDLKIDPLLERMDQIVESCNYSSSSSSSNQGTINQDYNYNYFYF